MQAAQLQNYLPPAERRFDQTGQVPNLGRGLATAGTNIARGLLTFSPAEDVRGAMMSSRDVMDSLRQGNYGQAAIEAAYLAAAPIGLMLPGSLRQYQETSEGLLSVFPKNQTKFKQEGIDAPGGKYIVPKTGQDITDKHYVSGGIYSDPIDGRGKMKVRDVAPPSDQIMTTKPFSSYPEGQQIVKASDKGAKIQTNLVRKATGWKWVDQPKGTENVQDLVAAVKGSDHFYAMGVEFPKGVTMSRYTKKADEPRLRPTAYGNMRFGKKIGSFKKGEKGKVHPVYDIIRIE